MANPNYELLSQSIARNAAAIISLPSAGMLRHHRTRFLGETENGFWVEAPPDDVVLIEQLIAESTAIGVEFKAGHRSVAFNSPILESRPGYAVNAQTQVQALFLPFPESFRQNQRRQVYRVQLPLNHQVQVRLWRIAERAQLRDRPMAAQEIKARLMNVSAMGLCALCQPTKEGQPPRLQMNERMRIQLSHGETEILLEGRVVHVRANPDNTAPMGLQFKKLERDIDGRQTLNKLTSIVGSLQREEIRRHRAVAVPA